MNFNNQLAKMQKIQKELAKKTDEFHQKEFECDYQNGSVVVSIKGDCTITGLKINPTLIDPEDPITLEEMVAEAVNDAIAQVKDMENEIAESMMPAGFGGMGLF